MSPIFNASALHGLSNHALHRLRAAISECLCGHHLTEGDRHSLCAALQVVDTVLRSRAVPPSPAPRPRF